MTIELQDADWTDRHRLAEIVVAAFQSGYNELLSSETLASVTVSTVLGWFQRWTQERRTIVAALDDEPVGFIRFGDDASDACAGYVASLYVHPCAVGRGIGTKLLDAALTALEQSGRRSVWLWVFRDNPRARKLYERAGFRPDGAEIVDPQWRVPQVRLLRRLAPAGPRGY